MCAIWASLGLPGAWARAAVTAADARAAAKNKRPAGFMVGSIARAANVRPRPGWMRPATKGSRRRRRGGPPRRPGGPVALARGGDSAAFREIMRRNNRRLFRAARGVLRDDAEAEDAVQEAYVH